MAKTVANMTSDELRTLIASVVEEKLVEILGDSDIDMTMREDVKERLVRQIEEVRQGERGESLDVVAGKLGLL